MNLYSALFAVQCCWIFMVSAAPPSSLNQGQSYPYGKTEISVCGNIRDVVRRNSARFRKILVRNANPEVDFSNDDCRRMSARAKSKLDVLASRVKQQWSSQKLKVVKAWTDQWSAQQPVSLHYEGRALLLQVNDNDRSKLGRLAGLALSSGFDWVRYPANSNYIHASVIRDVCQTSVDLAFILDTSGSVGSYNFEKMKTFVKNIVDFFNIGPTGTHVGMITYSTSAQVEFSMRAYSSKSDLKTAVTNIYYRSGWTYTAEALHLARRTIFQTANGMRPDRGIPKIAVLLTDGYSNGDAPLDAANQLRSSGVNVFCIGIGNYYERELNDIATDPDSDHVFKLSNFNDLNGWVDTLSAVSCDEGATIRACDNTESTVAGGSFLYFRTEFSSTTGGISVEVSDITGVSHLYVSLTNKNPGPLDPSSYKSESSISPRSLRVSFSSSRSSKLVFVAVQGQMTTNSFKLSMWDTIFSSDSFSASVKEGESTVQNVITVASSISGYTFKYSFMENSNKQGLFTIDAASGRIRTAGSPFDRETTSRYRLTVLAQDVASTCHKGRTVVVVDVEDKNDNPPKFAKNQYTFDVQENQPAGRVATVTATDADSGINARLTYSLTGGLGKFEIDSTRGELRTLSSLDYETKSSYTMTITATDGGNLKASAQIVVNVLDVNERPSFSASCVKQGTCQQSVSESASVGATITTLAATDPDGNSLTYSVRIRDSQDKVFGINAGRITLLKKLDRETKAFYKLVVVASDGRLIAEAALSVDVQDENDNNPKFPQQRYSARIYEDVKVGSVVTQVTATDADSGTNALLSYSLVSGDTGAFSVDSQGVLRTQRTFNREQRSSYQISMRAQDGGSPPRTGQAVVDIVILDVNDNRPVFTSAQYTVTVDEDRSVGSAVTTVKAMDADTGINADLRYTITSGNEDHAFTLDTITGAVKVARQLDFEQKQSYSLGLSVSDRGAPPLSATSRLVITVRDVNDNNPVFNPSAYRAAVKENKATGTTIVTVYATDRDSGSNGALLYSIVGGNDGTFAINPNTGVITIAQSPDFEKKSRYDLTIQASDQGSTPRMDTVKVAIAIEDENDHAPVFNPASYTKNVRENVTVGTTVVTVTASDKDSGPRGRVAYRIASGNVGNKFSIDTTTGAIRVSSALDRETTPSYTLQVEARDGGQPSKMDSAQVVLSIQDVNDNSPVFGGPFVFRVSESSSTGHKVGQVVATDADAATNGAVIYSLNDNTAVFSINSGTGDISLKKPVDHEVKASYRVSVTARDNGTPPRSSFTVVMVMVDDVNDNSPVFAKNPYTCSVGENLATGVAVCRVMATDADSGANGRLAYSISTGNTNNAFKIDRSTGEITTTSPLDREGIASYQLTVAADDGGSSRTTTTTTVNINIQDENDNRPVFTGNNRFAIREDASVGAQVGQVTARDSDVGPNGKVTYAMINGNLGNSFQVNSQSGAITVKSRLNREQIASYTLTLKASDAGTPPQSQTTSVVVTVQDVNDNAPRFLQSVFHGGIREDASVASTVLQVKAQDTDEGANGQITFSLSGKGSDNFTIGATGFIRTQTPLDYETSSSYLLTVTARDGGNPPLNATAHVNISVINVNDNVPTFVSPAQVTRIPEDVAVNTRVVKLNATDSDGTRLTFAIESGNIGSSFKIDRDSGLISVARRLDRETTANYTLVVKATEDSSSGISVYNNASIQVLDVNDNAPVFRPSSYNKTLSENQPSGQTIAKVTATDRDEGENARITYELTSGDPTKFQINPTTGLVTTQVQLDREQQASYNLIVTAKDHGIPSQSSVATITLTIADVNDNSPRFPQSRYTLTVMENTAINSNILRAQATDPDAGTNGRVRHSIRSGNTGGVFKIDSSTGVIAVAKSVDRETTASYTLTIRAQDAATPPRYTDASVSITIADENDNAPVFKNTTNVFRINENLRVGSLVNVITATDKDAGTNSKIVYSITSGDTGAFALDATTGRLTVKGSIDRETVASYPLTIRASDSGAPVMYTERQFSVVVNDLNDNSPVFNSRSYAASVPENSPQSTSVLTVAADDADVGANAVVRYQIVSGNSQSRFSINGTSGVISNTVPLDYEEKAQYVLQVSATDTKYTANVTVTINVIDVNDIRPTFSQSSYTGSVKENSATLTSIVTVSASDRDPFGSLVYSIKPGRNSDKFSVDQRSGVVSTADSLDREVIDRYTIQVQVTDGGNPPLSDIAHVTINVLDENDNTPTFDKQRYSTSIKENIPVGSSIMNVTATDADSGNNAKLTYSFRSTHSTFSIDPITGVITTKKEIDREAVSSYVLYVKATDKGNPQLTSNVVPINIRVLDINDNAPRFKSSVISNISENAAVGSIVAELQAVDPDLGLGGVVAYEFTTNQTMFVIANTTGVITLAMPLDRERTHLYDLEVRARDHGNLSLSSTTKLRVIVLDINDHRPQINASSGSVRENQPKGTHVMRVLASDADTGLNAELVFSVISDEHRDVFVIDNSTGDICTKKPLDREKQALYTVRISVSDRGNPSLSTVADVAIDVIDEDDNCPQFQPVEYNATISEDLPKGSSIVTVKSVDIDGDKDTNYEIKSITPSGGFTIDRRTGTIKVSSAGVDREDSDVFKLVIRAGKEHCGATNDTGGGEGGGGRFALDDNFQVHPSALATVIVRVTDVNDNPPMFSQSSYEYDFNDVSKVTLLTIHATDKDSNENGTVKYRLAGQTEMGGNRVVTVEAYDQGSPSKSSNVTVTIRTSVSCEAMVFAINESGVISTKTLCNFVVTPDSTTVIAGSPYTFKCSAKGNTRPQYRWMRNGLYLDSFTDDSDYVIKKLTREDAGVYSCLATSEAGLIQSSAATLTVQERPEITMQPENTSVELGKTAKLECRAKGVPEPEYQWYKRNEVIPSMSGVEPNQPVLVLQDSIAADEAPYYCMATNAAGTVKSRVATIKVYGGTSLVSLEITVTKGDPVKRCNIFDIDAFKNSLHNVVEAKIVIANFTAEGMCEANPCNANPCLHGGICQQQITMDYTCLCRAGWYGKNCQLNLDECKGDPCFNNGTCHDREGTYECACTKSSTGKKCELKKGACANNNCASSSQVCVLSETSPTSPTGYKCKDKADIIEMAHEGGIGGDENKIFDLEKEIEGMIQSAPDVNNASVTTRRLSRRSVLSKSVSNDFGSCVVRIITPIVDDKVQFVLLCPRVVDPTSTSMWVCGVLFKAGKTGRCGATGAMVTPVPPTTLPPVEPMRVIVQLFARDRSGKSIHAEELIDQLNSEDFNTAMKQQGVKFVAAKQVKPQPLKGEEEKNTGLIVGLVIGCGLAACILAAVMLLYYRKKKSGHKHIELTDRAQMNRGGSRKNIIDRNVSVKDISRSEKRFVNQAYTDSMCDDDEAEFMVEVDLRSTPKMSRSGALNKLLEARWYYGRITQVEAEKILNDHTLQPGTFVAHKGKANDEYMMTVVAPEGGPAYRHLVVRHTSKGTFTAQFGTMASAMEFNSFSDVVDHFQVTPIEFDETSPDVVLLHGWTKTVV